MATLESKIREKIENDEKFIDSVSKIITYDFNALDEATRARVKKESDAAKKSKVYKLPDIPEEAQRGNLYVYVIDIPHELLHFCFRFKNKSLILPASAIKMSKQMIKLLVDMGVHSIESHIWDIATVVDHLVNTSSYIYAVDKVGIVELNGQWGIALNEFIHKGEPFPYMFLGSDSVATKGKRDKYYDQINDWMSGKPKLQTMLALSISGLIAQIIKMDDDRILFFAYGKTSSGKVPQVDFQLVHGVSLAIVKTLARIQSEGYGERCSS